MWIDRKWIKMDICALKTSCKNRWQSIDEVIKLAQHSNTIIGVVSVSFLRSLEAEHTDGCTSRPRGGIGSIGKVAKASRGLFLHFKNNNKGISCTSADYWHHPQHCNPIIARFHSDGAGKGCKLQHSHSMYLKRGALYFVCKGNVLTQSA